MSETIESISKWAGKTFGHAKPVDAMARAVDEVRELLFIWEQWGDTQPERLVEEAADVCITLYRYIYLVDKEAIEKKMAINRARTWKLHGDGTGQHHEERESNP